MFLLWVWYIFGFGFVLLCGFEFGFLVVVYVVLTLIVFGVWALIYGMFRCILWVGYVVDNFGGLGFSVE